MHQPPPPKGPPPVPDQEGGGYFMQEEVPGLEDVETMGDVPWFADDNWRGQLRAAISHAHAAQKIAVASGADEIARICPEDGRVLGAGGVLRLGGSNLGGFG